MKGLKKLFGRNKNKKRSSSSSQRGGKSSSVPTTVVTSSSRLLQETTKETEVSTVSHFESDVTKEFTLPSDSVVSTGEVSTSVGVTETPTTTTTDKQALPQHAAKVSFKTESPTQRMKQQEKENPAILRAYDAVPVLEQTRLPRGGVSVETQAVGRVQFGLPPETIKDSMRLGIPVPQVYIVPVERFCREMGPALGVNLAEFEFPAYFNFFIYKKRCTLVVDSEDAEENIRRVFSETLLGPAQFRRKENPMTFEEEDFAPDFPRDAIPNFERELKHFRIMPDGKELVIETLLSFNHFETRSDGHEGVLGVPPPVDEEKTEESTPSASGASTPFPLETDEEEEAVPKDLQEVEQREEKKQGRWTYSQAKFMGDVAVVWPFTATEEEKKNRSVPRVEIFKMPGGTEYIIHDVDANNNIIGKARLSGHVKVPEAMSVEGFGGHSILDDIKIDQLGSEEMQDVSEHPLTIAKPLSPPTFHPPSFGVTVLGNSHGFDKSGSVSGYVLWINGRGVMIDPPPYSSATLEREGIRPRTIVGIILTHCHADHDAGAFQKVLTGSPVVVITTPTIYKSFIRKYAALSALSPALLRHSHRYKPAIIGQPLRFQGATFHFTYTLHSIPCVGFRVEWRGRSMVFTGDHFNSPPDIEKLVETGVLSRGRADDLQSLPLQETDVLLHEAGVPPLHTPLAVLLKLPERVKKRLFVVHTSALPDDCELKVAPTGTAGTIRLDQTNTASHRSLDSTSMNPRAGRDNVSIGALGTSDDILWSGGMNEYETIAEESVGATQLMMATSLAHLDTPTTPQKGRKTRTSSVYSGDHSKIPLVSLRPPSSTDAWFILNLLSAVPYLSSLSYASAMEVLETAKVDAYCMNDVIIPASRRGNVLCVVWEGTCSERISLRKLSMNTGRSAALLEEEQNLDLAVWHAGDWTGPLALQPDRHLSGESKTSSDHDVVAISSVGVKVITIDTCALHAILKAGSPLYRRYLERKASQERAKLEITSTEATSTTEQLLDDAVKNLNVLELLNCNSALRKLNAVQKRHLESLAEGPISFQPGERLWRAGTPVDKAFLLVSGTASFVPKRRNAGSASASQAIETKDDNNLGDPSVGDSMRLDAAKVIKELGVKPDSPGDESSAASVSSLEEERRSHFQFDTIFSRTAKQEEVSETHDYDKLSRGLQKRADFLQKEGSVTSENMSADGSNDELDSIDMDQESQLDYTFTDEADAGKPSKRSSVIRRRSSRARFANKVLGRLYSRRAFTGGLVFSRGHFLGDVSKMVAGLLSSDGVSVQQVHDESEPSYGFGDTSEGRDTERLMESLSDLVIHEQEGDHRIMHSSTLTAGKDGCVALVFPKSALIPFLDEYPGLLLSLLGTQVVV